jgi:hypothetical protein
VTIQWTTSEAWDWYNHQPWLVGCNFIPSTAINQLEMWQMETFDPDTIDYELEWAASLGFNSIRVYLHDLLWDNSPDGYRDRIDRFLNIASSHRIRPIFVIFDDCWNSDFSLGKQPEPKPGVHNSGWAQSPGVKIVNRPLEWNRLQRYVKGLLTTFRHDVRILMWDLYNEPGNSQQGEKSLPLLQAAFEWAWSVRPSQPLTAGLWFDDKALNNFQLSVCDVITFHNYGPAKSLEDQIDQLRIYDRPLICTEYMARPADSRFETHLPMFKRERVGCLNWGLVAGKTNTIFAWNTPLEAPEPPEWFHDIFHKDGTPYRQEEVDFIRQITRDKAI